ncbi:MAG: T9SS type A sorting domain-containing protein [Flavobacteriales bacterium]
MLSLMTGAQRLTAQRYLTEVFNQVQITNGVTYGVNATVLYYSVLNQAFPEQLKMDIYQPAGDSEMNRPVILYFHSGNFLPYPLNGKTGGTRKDSAVVEICSRFARMGYVVASCDYRMGWNPLAATEPERAFTFINAFYRGVQDCRTAVRFMRKTQAEQGNPYRIDVSKIAVWGEGSGGYIALGAATLDNWLEDFAMIPKFNWDPYGTGPIPMIIEQINGNADGTTVGMINGDTLSYPNHEGYSSAFNVMVNMGGAMGDISWLEDTSVPMISFHSPTDPFDPYNTGTIIVPTTVEEVLEVTGSYGVQQLASAFNNNDVFSNAEAWSPGISYTNAANARNQGYFGLYPFLRTGGNIYDSSPWEWWNPALVDSTNNANGLMLNPDMSATKARTFIDTIQGYAAPRIMSALALPGAPGELISGCTAVEACNYNPLAVIEDFSCTFPGDPCNDGNSNTFGEYYNTNCACVVPSIPLIITASNQTYQCDATVLNYPTPTVSGGCGEPYQLTYTDVEETIAICRTDIIRTWMVTDACGNTATKIVRYSIVDTQAPVFLTFPADVYVSCSSNMVVPIFYPTYDDNCDPYSDIELIIDTLVSYSGCVSYIFERRFTIWDICGNSASRVQRIYFYDSEPPVVSGNQQSSFLFNCGDNLQTPPPVATDNCSDIAVPTYIDSPHQPSGCSYQFNRTWTVADACGNESLFTQNISVIDIEAPQAVNTTLQLVVSALSNVPVFEWNDCNTVSADVSTTTITDACGTLTTEVHSATDVCGNAASFTRQIRIPSPALQQTVNASIAPGQTYAFNGQTLSTAGTYTAVVEASSGCDSLVTLFLSIDSINPCSTLEAYANVLYEGYCGSETAIEVIAAGGTSPYSGTGTYYEYGYGNFLSYTVTDANGCTAQTNEVYIPSPNYPFVYAYSINGNYELTCAEDSILLYTQAGAACGVWNVYWYNDSFQLVGTGDYFYATQPGNYYVELQDYCGCMASSNFSITQNITPPNVLINNSSSYTEITCSGSSTCLQATGAVSYEWDIYGQYPQYTGDTWCSDNNYGGQVYNVVGYGANGCSSTATAQILLTPVPSTPAVIASSNELTCDLQTVTLTVLNPNPSYTYYWYSYYVPSFMPLEDGMVELGQPGAHYIGAIDMNSFCQSNEAEIILVQDIVAPVANITNLTGTASLSCGVSSIQLQASGAGGGGAYSWTGGLGNSANAVVTQPGVYTVTVTGANGCTSEASIVITSDGQLPNAAIINPAGVSTLDCNITAISLIATGGQTYSWDNGLGNSPSVTIAAPGVYTVTASAANGCTSTASIVITQDVQSPNVSITTSTGTTSIDCNTPSIILNAIGGDEYHWSNGSNSSSILINQAGVYSVTAIGFNGCSSVDVISITDDLTIPEVSINSSNTALNCSGESLQLTAIGAFYYQWSTGETTSSIEVSSPGVYSVYGYYPNGCGSTAEIVVSGDGNPPVAGITNNTGSTVLTCTVSAISLTATGGVAYSWSGGLGNAPSVTVTQVGVYSVTVFGANGCSDTQSITIASAGGLPNVAITNNSNTTELTCNTNSINLTATGGQSYVWNNGLGNSPSVTITAPGVYTVTASAANGCASSASIVITEDSVLPNVAITSDNGFELDCNTPSISLIASGAIQYQWSPETVNTAVISVTDPGDYCVTASGANGCEAVECITIVENTTSPVASIINNTGTTVLSCNQNQISLTATGGIAYSWSNGLNNATVTVTAPGTYSVTVTAANGCIDTQDITITLDGAIPVVAINNLSGTNVLTCAQDEVMLEAVGGMSYMWSQGLGNSSLVTITAPGTYTVTATEANGCEATASIVIAQNFAIPDVTITSSDGYVLDCNTSSISLTATGGTQYLWSNGLGNTSTVNITQAGTYAVTVSADNGCANTQNVTITQSSEGAVFAGEDLSLSVCTESPAISLFDALGSGVTAGGVWTGDVTLNNDYIGTLNPNNLTSGTYNFVYSVGQVGSTCGSDFSVVSITVNEGAPTTIAYSSPFCVSQTVAQLPLLLGVAGGEFSSSLAGLSISNAGAIVPSLSAPGIYLVTYTPSQGTSCNSQATATVVIDAVPTATIAASGSTQLCPGGSVTLSAPAGYTYLWNNGTTAQSVTATMPGAYSVTVTSASGCTATSAITNVSNAPANAPVITANGPTTFCEGLSVQLTSSAGSAYNWNTGSTSQALMAVASGDYFVTVTNASGCALQSNTIHVEVFSTIDASITASGNTTICEGQSVTLTASAGTSYLWSNGSTSPSISVNESGSYAVVVSGSGGCTGTSESVQVTVTPQPYAIVSVIGSTSFCANQSVTLSVSGALSYLWSNGATTQSITVNTSGDYSVTTSNGPDCEATSNPITIEVVEYFIYYTDADMDGYGDSNSPVQTCTLSAGLSQSPGDCDDNNSAIGVAAMELCDGIDNNCDEVVDENCNGQVLGCTVPVACNYNSAATEDDGSCTYPGCTAVDACNYSSTAGCDDGSCLASGCTSIQACNYNSAAGCDDGSCEFAGCMDIVACNYNPSAGCDDGSCTWAGCTDISACNYNASAGCDDGSCVMGGCTDPDACNYDPSVSCDDGSCVTIDTYSLTGDQTPAEFTEALYTYEDTPGSTYTWTVTGGAALLPNTQSSVTVIWSVPGVAEVCVQETNAEGCAGSQVCLSLVIIPNSVDERESSSMILYPNPTRNRAWIEVSSSWLQSNLSVMNPVGEVVFAGKVQSSRTELNVQPFAAGVYAVQIRNESGETRTLRLVVE